MLHKLRKLTFSQSFVRAGAAVAPGLFYIHQTSHAVSHRRNEKQGNVGTALSFFSFFIFDQPITAQRRGCRPSSPVVVNSNDPARGPVTQTNMSAPDPQHDPGTWLPDRDQRSQQFQKMCSAVPGHVFWAGEG